MRRQNDRRGGKDSRRGNDFGGGDRFGGGFKSNFRPDNRQFSGPREMHKATCADCGKECEVPFKPRGDKPVYCRDCFAKHRPPRFD